ncbi:MAG: septal ring lytic transglycosylase RlpA family protein [Candidatus Riflebacteria bacterium]|nr:septal ring lytic transglycosylase RlpA family protein [Candidatus Riflebacteria bacterium]
MKKIFLTILLLVYATFVLGCSDSSSSDSGHETGKLVVYEQTAHKAKITASDETYDETLFTAAHASYFFDTWLVVTNLENGRRTTVRVNDRLSSKDDHIIKVSKAAARELGLLFTTDTAQVSLYITAPQN